MICLSKTACHAANAGRRVVGGAASTQSGGRVMVVAASSMQATQRGGSAESALSTGLARFAGESLRATGITMWTGGQARYGAVPQDRDADPFVDRELHAGEFWRAKSGFGVRQVVDWEDEECLGDWDRDRHMEDERSRTSGSSICESEGMGPPPSRGILCAEHLCSVAHLYLKGTYAETVFPLRGLRRRWAWAWVAGRCIVLSRLHAQDDMIFKKAHWYGEIRV